MSFTFDVFEGKRARRLSFRGFGRTWIKPGRKQWFARVVASNGEEFFRTSEGVGDKDRLIDQLRRLREEMPPIRLVNPDGTVTTLEGE
jgi:hypothetical protein